MVMDEIRDKEWLFYVMKLKMTGRYVALDNKEIVDAYDSPLDAAETCDKLNEDIQVSRTFYFLEARPVIASVECESVEF